MSEEDVPLSVRREKTKRDEKSSLKRKKSEDLSPSDLPSTNLLDIHKQESLIASPLSKPIKYIISEIVLIKFLKKVFDHQIIIFLFNFRLEINTDDVLPAEHEANDMQLDSTNVLDIKAEPQQFVRYSTVSLICYYGPHLFYLFLFFILDFRCRNLKVSYPKAEVANI